MRLSIEIAGEESDFPLYIALSNAPHSHCKELISGTIVANISTSGHLAGLEFLAPGRVAIQLDDGVISEFAAYVLPYSTNDPVMAPIPNPLALPWNVVEDDSESSHLIEDCDGDWIIRSNCESILEAVCEQMNSLPHPPLTAPTAPEPAKET